MADVDSTSERKKNLWTWVAVTLWAGFVVWAIAGRDPADGKGGAKPPAQATQSITPSPTQSSRSLPAEPPSATPSMDPVAVEGVSVSDAEFPRTPTTPPSPIKLRREKASQCGVSVLSPTKFRHELQGGIGQPAVIETYTADATWGAVVISCLRDDPAPPHTDINVAAESALQNLRSAPDWKVVRERNVRIGKHIATEVDAVAANGPVWFARWRLVVVGDVIHMHTLMAQYDPSSVPELDTLLDSVKLNKKAGRGLSRSAITVWPSGQSSASGSSWSPVLPPLNTGGDVQVRGYYRSDGTYVRPHTRSRPKR